MDKYQSLRIWSYQPPNEALENEYLARFKSDQSWTAELTNIRVIFSPNS